VWNAQTNQAVITFGAGGTVSLNDGVDYIRPDTNYFILYNSGESTLKLTQLVSNGAGAATEAANGIVVAAGASFEMAVDYGAYSLEGKRLGEGVGIRATGTNGQTFTLTCFNS
jgi:hypothetical protein